MTHKNKLVIAIIAAGISTQVAAVEVADVNGTKFSIGGYVKAEGVVNKPDDGDQDFEASTRQTRLNFTADTAIDDHKVKAFVEMDFWGNNTDDNSTFSPRLRHAFIAVDDVTVGQTWAGQFFATAPFDVEMMSFWNPGLGTIGGNGAVIRPELLIHYTLGGLRLSAQDPVWDQAAYPDMVASYTYRTGAHGFNLAVTGRDVGTGGGINKKSEFGAAVSAAMKLQFGNTALAVSAYTGEGTAVFAGWGYDGARGADQNADVNTATGELITTTGFSAGVTQKFMPNLRGTVRYGQVRADEVAATVPDDRLEMVNVNLIYTYLPGLDLGIEWRDLNAATRPPTARTSSKRPKGQQVELMAMYKF